MLESKIVTVFGSSRPKEGDAGYAEARELGYALAAKGFVVCTGGYGGVMESASRGAKDAGGRSKGGTGTLVELAVVWEMLNKGVMEPRPFVVLGGFWQPIIERVREVELSHPSPWGEANNRMIEVASSPGAAADYLASKLPGCV